MKALSLGGLIESNSSQESHELMFIFLELACLVIQIQLQYQHRNGHHPSG